MNDQIPDKKISDYVGLPISISHCTLRMHRDSLTAFVGSGTPHMLRFRRVFKNIMELNGLYDIYIDADFKLLLYENDRPGTIAVTDSTGTPVVFRYTNLTEWNHIHFRRCSLLRFTMFRPRICKELSKIMRS